MAVSGRALRVIVIASLILLFSCAGARQEIKAVVPTGSDGVQRVDVVAGEYFFRPNHIIVKAGLPVEITIRKEPSIIPHDFILEAPDAGIDVSTALSTEPKTVRFTAKKPGEYVFYCDHKFLFKSHRASGMEGVLEVTGE